MADRQVVTLPYLEEYAGGPQRPYLWLHFTGPNGANGPIQGLVDTGADVSTLPLGYAQLMGYGPDDLAEEQIHGVGGQVDAYRPKVPCIARVIGIDFEFKLRPVFVAGSDALWGRQDFMMIFSVIVDEASCSLGLILPPGATVEPPPG